VILIGGDEGDSTSCRTSLMHSWTFWTAMNGSLPAINSYSHSVAGLRRSVRDLVQWLPSRKMDRKVAHVEHALR